MLLDERINLPKEKRSDHRDGSCAAGDENSVLFDEIPAVLPFVNQRPALEVFLQCRVKISLFHERLQKKKKPRRSEASYEIFIQEKAEREIPLYLTVNFVAKLIATPVAIDTARSLIDTTSVGSSHRKQTGMTMCQT